MSNKESKDPYTYPDSSTLINKFDIRDPDVLQRIEGIIFQAQVTLPLPEGNLDYTHLKAIHKHYFGDVYTWAGEQRTVNIVKGDSYFAHVGFIAKEMEKLFAKLKDENYLQGTSKELFCDRLSYYFNEINAAHPFREGNGRTQRAFCDLVANKAGYYLDWGKTTVQEYTQANINGFLHADYESMAKIFKQITSPLTRTQEQTVDVKLNENTIIQIKDYIQKQVALTELVSKKNSSFNQPEIAKELGLQARALSHELRNQAKALATVTEVEEILKKSEYVSLQAQGGFSAINNRVKQNMLTEKDMVSVLRYAKNTTQTVSLTLNQEQSRGGGRSR